MLVAAACAITTIDMDSHQLMHAMVCGFVVSVLVFLRLFVCCAVLFDALDGDAALELC